MNLSSKTNRKGALQYIGIRHHEYWSWWLLVIPVWPLWIWYAIRLRCATWFTTVNPGMEDSGFMGESKMKILDSIPEEYKPLTLFVPTNTPLEDVKNDIIIRGLSWPLICKPDIGGRGRKVEILSSVLQLKLYHEQIGEDYIIQDLIPYEFELGIFYVRLPDSEKGRITSVAIKSFLAIEGDGIKTIEQLMKMEYRSSLQIERLSEHHDLSKIPVKGERVLLEPIGNHCRGTSFINGNHLITEKLNETFDIISKKITGFYYGRYDLRAKSLDDLYEGRTIKILELNGLTADAAHIFDPNYRLRDAYLTQIKQCTLSYQIAKRNLAKGTRPTPLMELISKSWKALKNE